MKILLTVTLQIFIIIGVTSFNKKTLPYKSSVETKTEFSLLFKEADLLFYVNEYESYIKNYKKALKSENITILNQLDEVRLNLEFNGRRLLKRIKGKNYRKLSYYLAFKTFEKNTF